MDKLWRERNIRLVIYNYIACPTHTRKSVLEMRVVTERNDKTGLRGNKTITFCNIKGDRSELMVVRQAEEYDFRQFGLIMGLKTATATLPAYWCEWPEFLLFQVFFIMDTYLSTYMKDYCYHNNPPMETRNESAEPPGQTCPKCGCVCTDCPQPQAEAEAQGPAHDDETCQYMHKLRQKYPFLLQVLQMLPPEDMIVRLYHDRLRTAHPADLCQDEKATVPAAPGTGGEAKADSKAEGPCQCPKPPPCRTEPSEPREVVVTGRTEYQDTIGATGARIMTEMLPYRQGRKAQKHH